MFRNNGKSRSGRQPKGTERLVFFLLGEPFFRKRCTKNKTKNRYKSRKQNGRFLELTPIFHKMECSFFSKTKLFENPRKPIKLENRSTYRNLSATAEKSETIYVTFFHNNYGKMFHYGIIMVPVGLIMIFNDKFSGL